MSYRSEIAKVLKKYYPQYKIKSVLAPQSRSFFTSNDIELKIILTAILIPRKSKDN